MGYVDLNVKGGTLGFGDFKWSNAAGAANFGQNLPGRPSTAWLWGLVLAGAVVVAYILKRKP